MRYVYNPMSAEFDSDIRPNPEFDSIQWNTEPGITEHSEGLLHWNEDDRTLEIGLANEVYLQIGQETVVYCRNNTGSDILNGSAVYVSGAIGNRPTIALAQADSRSTTDTFIGLVTEDIANNTDGFVTTFGLVRGLNTNDYDAGTLLYLSPTNPGEWTDTRPTAPNIAVAIGVVTRKNPDVGVIAVKPLNRPTLEQLSSVYIDSVTDGDRLHYNASNSRCENVSESTTYNNVTDVDTATYDLVLTDNILHVSYTATGDVTSLTLPDAQCIDGRSIVIKNVGGTNTVTIDSETATIDGQSTVELLQYQSINIYAYNGSWFAY